MHSFCSGAATVMQWRCNYVCSGAATAMQWHCNRYAVALQPLCSSDAAVMQ
ncbi:hypothetical protein [uncultured Bacteroides sp.]|uniref:hypothetical protein n=1 Tax=uncultured Bacteroides sp. TaxID=162156 RepID=UPI00272A5CC6|nr:hypothetical protein [uncultured Bacteroides sp.]